MGNSFYKVLIDGVILMAFLTCDIDHFDRNEELHIEKNIKLHSKIPISSISLIKTQKEGNFPFR